MRRREFTRVLASAPFGSVMLRGASHPEPIAIQSGDIRPGSGVVWVRASKPGEMKVSWRTAAKGGDVREVKGPSISEASDLTGRVDLRNLPPGQRILYTVKVEGTRAMQGSFRTPPLTPSDIRFLWSGDMVGQGWGINPSIGGIRIFETMRRLEPQFFLHSGDTIYADSPVPAEVQLPSGEVWKNITTEEKSKVAETLDEFRGNYRYNLLDEHVRRFSSEVTQLWQWDDHEVMNNWSPSKDLRDDARYKEKNVQTLVERGRQAFLEYSPLRLAGSRIYRLIPYGPLLDVFLLDMRSYRGPNTYNRQTIMTPESAYLGARQLQWLKQALAGSKATWKVIAADMPIGLLVADGKDAEDRRKWEASANGDGPPLGRELEIADLLRHLKRNNVRNTVWLTADVHYTAAHLYHPSKAQFTDFLPFYEFVSGPLNAGTFGPGQFDNTFGPELLFAKAPPKDRANLCPLEGMQFFGDVQINGKTREMSVTLRDLTGNGLYSKTLAPETA